MKKLLLIPFFSLLIAGCSSNSLGAFAGPFENKKVNSALSNLTDITITSLADDEFLQYDSATGKWLNQTIAPGAATPADGTDGDIQFNNADVFSSDTDFTYASTTKTLSVPNLTVTTTLTGTLTGTASGNDVLGQATSTLASHTTTYNHANYDTAYGWGDHAGLYDILGQATSTLSSHTTTYDHTAFLTTVDISADTNLTAGTNITLTGDDLSVDDAFILNTGDIGTGGYDFGGADWLEIPNGTAPSVATSGVMAIDTTNDDQLLYYGDELNVITPKYERCLTIASTSIATFEDAIIWQPYRAITVQEQRCRVVGGTSLVMNISDGTNDMDSITCGTSITKDSTLTNNTWSADEQMTIEFGTMTGIATTTNYCIIYTYDRD